MEIINSSSPATSPSRSTSAVGDGDVGQNSPHYQRHKKNKQPSQEEAVTDQTPRKEVSTSRIDIRV